MLRTYWPIKGVALLLCAGAVAGTQSLQTNVLTSGVAVEADRCLPPNAVDVMFDERSVAAFDDTGCAVTDRHVYCTTGQSKAVQQFALHDMHIRSLSAQSGKIIMRAPEKTLIFYPAQHRFEYLPLR